MAPIRPFDGAFSFTTSRLHANIERVLPRYNNKDPRTWPLVTLAMVEKQRPYHGFPDLPTGVAYERAVTKRYEEVYTPRERAEIASMNGSFHERYPYNYDENDEPKEQVSMSTTEYHKDVAKVAAANIDETRYPERNLTVKRSKGSEGSKDTGCQPCTNSGCLEMKREVARLQGELFDKGSQLMSSQEYVREYETTEGLRRTALKDAEYGLDCEKRRADAAEEICMARKRRNMTLLHWIRNTEMKESQMDDLKAYFRRLEAELRDLRRTAKKRGRDEVAEPDSGVDLSGSDKRRRSAKFL